MILTVLPKNIIRRFDAFLAKRDLKFEGIIIGGTALALLNVIERQTKDCDVLHPLIDPTILGASKTFALGVGDLDEDWLNNGPKSLLKVLPKDWEKRKVVIFEGEALTLYTLGRTELLMSKVFALCDRGFDLSDCIALKPTEAELDGLMPWLEQQDANPTWPEHVKDVVANLKKELGYGV